MMCTALLSTGQETFSRRRRFLFWGHSGMFCDDMWQPNAETGHS